jgi:hypothetical protein
MQVSSQLLKGGQAMKTVTILLMAAVAAVASGQTASPPADDAATRPKARIGVYDNRAIAVAYAASSFNPIDQKMEEHKTAKLSGDDDKINELKAWGESQQRQLHFQGFGRVPVGDLLQHVKEGVAKLAADMQLTAIAMQCDYTAPDAELIDVTDQLVELFKPSAKTRDMARKVRTAKPLSLLTLADMPASQ